MTFAVETGELPANEGGVIFTPETDLAHEVKHFVDYISGESSEADIINVNDPVSAVEYEEFTHFDNNTIKYDEVTTVETENIVRAEMGYDLRTMYGGIYVLNKEISKSTKRFYSKKFNTYGTGYYLVNKKTPIDFKRIANNTQFLTQKGLSDYKNQFSVSEPMSTSFFGTKTPKIMTYEFNSEINPNRESNFGTTILEKK